jgi:hypothetical protein
VGTSNSSSVAFCDPGTFYLVFDVRSAKNLLSDAGIPLTDSGANTSPALQFILQAAAGRIEASCTVSSRYSPADLAGLTGNSAAFLAQLNARLAVFDLWTRRPDPNTKLPEECKLALSDLRQLEDGKLIFGTVEHAQAGLEKSYSEHPSDVHNRGMVTTLARRLYGRRSNDYPYPNEG